MGEFGAVSVVSGHIRGQTNTMPLHVEMLYNEYQSVAAFAVASLLALLAHGDTDHEKSAVEWRHEREMKAHRGSAARAARSTGSGRACAKWHFLKPCQPAQAGIHGLRRARERSSHVRGNDEARHCSPNRRIRLVMSIAIRQCQQAVRRLPRAARRQRSTSNRASSWHCSGPSGCGKTTLLRIIAGLETADAGSILFSGEDTTDVHVRERKVGFVFQHYALFRHMTVFENVAFGLRVKPRAVAAQGSTDQAPACTTC
jgi:ABC-type glutathione transport system ATPase component